MEYIDLNGKIVKHISEQDKILNFLYKNPFGRLLLKPLVQPKISELAGKFLSTPLSANMIKTFIRNHNIDMTAYEEKEYKSFNDFFTRKIKDGRRPVPEDPQVLISPCDCKATVHPIQKNSILSIKDTEYTLRSLLKSQKLAKRFQGGYAYVLRLTVDDYHRYLYAVSGRQSKNYHIEGTYHTVNPFANDYLPIYKENTREYTVIHSEEFGDVVQMEVGALLVGKISNHKESCTAVRGEEKGFFEYGGSTIVLLTAKNAVIPRTDLITNTRNGYETKLLQGHVLGSSTRSPKASK